jgi:TPR repeat protein
MRKATLASLLQILTMVFLALPAAAQDLQKGQEAAKRGDFATALEEWRRLAEQGLAAAQFDLGVLYEN